MNDSRSQGLYPKDTIANLLNISERRLEQLAKKKIVPKAGRGVFDLGATVTAYIRYLQGLCTGTIRNEEHSELDKRLLEAKVLERESKARQAKYRADAMEQELTEGKLRNKVQEIPHKLDFRLSCIFSNLDYGDKQKIVREIRSIVDEILNDYEKS